MAAETGYRFTRLDYSYPLDPFIQRMIPATVVDGSGVDPVTTAPGETVTEPAGLWVASWHPGLARFAFWHQLALLKCAYDSGDVLSSHDYPGHSIAADVPYPDPMPSTITVRLVSSLTVDSAYPDLAGLGAGLIAP